MNDVNAPYPFPDTLQEFSVQTNNYSAQYGQSSGAVVNIVTKSDGDQFHGDLFKYLRNGYFNAKPFFANRTDALHRHQFGGTIGGPLIIPRTFEGQEHAVFLRLSAHAASPAQQLVHGDCSYAGGRGHQRHLRGLRQPLLGRFNSSNLCTNANQQIVNPFTQASYLLNRIPVSALDKSAFNVLSHIPTFGGTPASGTVGGLINYNVPTTQSFDEYLGRVDHSFGDANHLFGHYYQDYFQNQSVYNPNNLLAYSGFSNIRDQNALLAETHTFSSHLVNSFVASYQREVALRGGPPGGPDVTDFGVNIWQPSLGTDLQAIAATGYFLLSGLPNAVWQRGNITFNDDLYFVVGKHDFGFGGHFEISRVDIVNINAQNGSFTSGTFSKYINALANFEMGYLTSFDQGQAYTVNNRNHFPAIYAQDSWKVTNRLTLDDGLRWETSSPWSNKYLGGMRPSFNPLLQRSHLHALSQPAGRSARIRRSRHGLQRCSQSVQAVLPRVGSAYDTFGDGKTVIRGGASIFYQDRIQGFFNLNQNGLSPYSIYVTPTNLGGTNVGGPFSNPYCTGCTPGVDTAGPIANPFPYTLPFPSNYQFPLALTAEEYDPSGQFRVPVTHPSWGNCS